MSSLILTGDTSGTITLAAPAVAGTHTLTMPVATGTAVLEDASGVLQMNSGYGSVAPAYGCRAWVNFNGTGTVAIRDSGNVSSITDFAVGVYYINFTTDMPDVNYSIISSSRNTGVTATFSSCAAHSVTQGFVNTRYPVDTSYDANSISVSVFR